MCDSTIVPGNSEEAGRTFYLRVGINRKSKIILWAGYIWATGLIWPAGCEFDICALAGGKINCKEIYSVLCFILSISCLFSSSFKEPVQSLQQHICLAFKRGLLLIVLWWASHKTDWIGHATSKGTMKPKQSIWHNDFYLRVQNGVFESQTESNFVITI